MEKQIKSKKRVADHGEVFTAEREVNAMLDLVKQETERVDSRFLEPACGDGNFLAEILRRKLKEVRRKYKRSPFDYEKNAVLAVSSIYGVDLMMDNVLACRERLFGIWDKEYKAVCKKETNDQTREAVRFILSRNIVCGNALTLMCVDEEGFDTHEPIVFSEWSFITGTNMQRKDYTFDELLNGKSEQKKPFHEDQIMFDMMDDPEPDPEGKLLAHYITHYRRVHENDTNWDLVIFDEYHFGAWRENAKKLFENPDEEADSDFDSEHYKRTEADNAYNESFLPITTDYYLFLSGTPFRAINSGEFIEDQIYNWTYSDEQKAKDSWVGSGNPYASLPRMVMLTYKVPESITHIAKQGEFDEFDLNVFFSAKGKGEDAKFVYENEVQKWLDLIRGAYTPLYLLIRYTEYIIAEIKTQQNVLIDR